MTSSRQLIFTFAMFFASVSHSFLLKPTAVTRQSQATILSMVSMEISSSADAPFTTNGSSNMVLDPLIVCGPSGVGKGTIIDKFMNDFGGRHRFGFTVSHTTRAPRPGEVDGIHYHFVTREEMESAIQSNLFLEHARVHGNLYGTSWKSLRDVQEQDKRCLLDIDMQGVQALKKQTACSGANWKPRYIFIAPPSLDRLLERLSSRGTEDELSLKRRTAMAQTEVDYGMQKGNFDGIIINDDLDKACREFTLLVKDLYSIA
jgi:guanylate kinase